MTAPRVRSSAYRKYELASLGAPADQVEGSTKVDPELLRRRAEAAAEAAALRYHEICDGRVYCTLYGLSLIHI